MSGVRRTQVAVVGAGPAGLVLANVLHRRGVDALVLERRSRWHVENHARAGLVEHRVAEHLRRWGLADRMSAEATRHGWCEVVVDGEQFRVDYEAGSGGLQHWIYPQQFLLRDLLGSLDAVDRTPLFEQAVREVDLTGPRPLVRADGIEVECEHVIGCDGTRGAVARAFPERHGVRRRYPYDWLTVRAELTGPVEAIRYAVHEQGFAGLMPRAGSTARLYLQVPADEDLARWPESRIREQLDLRLGTDRPDVVRIEEIDVLRMRSGIAADFRCGRAFLAGDAAHLLTPSGAKGMNLAIGDAADLADALAQLHVDGDGAALDGYADRRRAEAARALAFSENLLHLLHIPPGGGDSALRYRRRRIREIAANGPAAERFARAYVGAGRLVGLPAGHAVG
ncbi:FAD-dependent monooxygenase [Saccharopolyspora sp. MS10]|uniref:FAD-dependent monooxygenase n=1 Tax=Saccharopolyspora sp. MS10 TaxID=3385973 RepID=UPI00399FD8A6